MYTVPVLKIYNYVFYRFSVAIYVGNNLSNSIEVGGERERERMNVYTNYINKTY